MATNPVDVTAARAALRKEATAKTWSPSLGGRATAVGLDLALGLLTDLVAGLAALTTAVAGVSTAIRRDRAEDRFKV